MSSDQHSTVGRHSPANERFHHAEDGRGHPVRDWIEQRSPVAVPPLASDYRAAAPDSVEQGQCNVVNIAHAREIEHQVSPWGRQRRGTGMFETAEIRGAQAPGDNDMCCGVLLHDSDSRHERQFLKVWWQAVCRIDDTHRAKARKSALAEGKGERTRYRGSCDMAQLLGVTMGT
jgi:hypothetical protein